MLIGCVADIANNVLYMVGLDGGLIPDDGDASSKSIEAVSGQFDLVYLCCLLDNYLVTLDLTSSFSVSEGKNYKMTKIDTDVPKIKDMALWSNAENSTLYQYGGRFLDNITSEDTIWTYAVKDKLWGKQDGTIQPSRLEYGGTLKSNLYRDVALTLAFRQCIRMRLLSKPVFG
jgi:hypothetical protein